MINTEALARTYAFASTIKTREERAEHRRMLARVRTKNYQRRQQGDAEWKEHRQAVQRASYHRNREKRTAAKRAAYVASGRTEDEGEQETLSLPAPPKLERKFRSGSRPTTRSPDREHSRR